MTATATPSLEVIRQAASDPVVFAEVLVGQKLWRHQVEVVRSPARYKMITAGRQSGKSRTLAVMALHQAFSKAGAQVLVVSAGDAAAKRLLDEITGLATSSPLLRGAVLDETKSTLILSNGSTIRSVPASQRQIRGHAVDLLVLDEAGFVSDDIWRAAEPSVIARPGSRIVLCSSPWGGPEAFFRVLWNRGKAKPDAMYASWHWPSSISPLVDERLLAEIRSRENADYFRREYLAEWVDGSGTYFTPDEINGAIEDDLLVEPMRARGAWAVAGVDWGLSHDASTLVVASALPDVGEGPRYGFTWLEERFRTPYHEMIALINAAEVPSRWSTVGYRFQRVVAESNGVGQYPAEELARSFASRGRFGVVVPTFTDARSKQDSFGTMKDLLQRGLLRLPRHPELLRQLAALEYAITESGALRVSVPDRVGHDDLAMGACLAVAALRAPGQRTVFAVAGNVGRRWSGLGSR